LLITGSSTSTCRLGTIAVNGIYQSNFLAVPHQVGVTACSIGKGHQNAKETPVPINGAYPVNIGAYLSRFHLLLLHLLELVLACSADGTYPIVGYFLERRAWIYAAVGVT
jgi:hypothetical protein